MLLRAVPRPPLLPGVLRPIRDQPGRRCNPRTVVPGGVWHRVHNDLTVGQVRQCGLSPSSATNPPQVHEQPMGLFADSHCARVSWCGKRQLRCCSLSLGHRLDIAGLAGRLLPARPRLLVIISLLSSRAVVHIQMPIAVIGVAAPRANRQTDHQCSLVSRPKCHKYM